MPLSVAILCVWSVLRLRRSREDATNKQLRQAATLLKAAAGISLAPVLELSAANVTEAATAAEAGGGEPAAQLPHMLARPYPGLEVAEGAHLEALKELANAYELGEDTPDLARHICRACVVALL